MNRHRDRLEDRYVHRQLSGRRERRTEKLADGCIDGQTYIQINVSRCRETDLKTDRCLDEKRIMSISTLNRTSMHFPSQTNFTKILP